jgi:glycosyltransferase involved in cell wall biosynthesis
VRLTLRRVKVLIFHGYLLRGTGSNVYNASLASALAALGHEVHLVCQDREAPELAAGAPGSVTIHNPEIGGLLPVFVRDAYEGFEVRTFLELSQAELDAYIEANVAAVEALVAELGGVDAALANHLIMGPVILSRAGLRYALKVHGSDLSYAVLPDLDRYRPYAEEACAGAAGILVGSGHIAERLALAVDDPQAQAKVRLGPPGVDVERFAPLEVASRASALQDLAARLRLGEVELGEKSPDRDANSPKAGGSAWDRDAAAAADALDWFAEAEGPRVIFVGKLIVSKGIDLLLAAWPLVHSANPGARLLVVGFGELEPVLQRVWAALAEGDLGPLRELAERGRGLEGAEDERLPILTAFLGALPADYAELAAAAGASVRFGGRLEHDEVAVPVAASDALVFPSTFPEAFGMVAAEAAATGALPVSAAHSGAAEVSAALADELPAALRGLVSFELGDDAVAAIAERLRAWLALPAQERDAAGAALRATVERLWSWEGVARGVLAAARGDLDGLSRPVVS